MLSEKFKAKIKDEEKASGIERDLSEVEKALEEIAEREAAAEDTVENSGNEKQSTRKPERNTEKAAKRRGGESKAKVKRS